jgi:hypothetical protein
MNFISTMLQKQKLTISFLLIIMIFVSFGIVTIKGLYILGDLTRRIHQHPLVVSNASLHAALGITKMHRSMKDVVLADSSQEIEARLIMVKEYEQKVYQELDTIKKDILGVEGKALETQTRQLFLNWQPIREEVVRLLESGKKKDAILITMNIGAEHVEKLETKMLELTSYARDRADTFLESAENSQSNLENITIILTISGVFVSIIIAFIATRLVSKAERLLQDKNNRLHKALDEIKTLRGILPICSFCKKIRNNQGSYEQIEGYIHKRSGVDFSHTICPSCMKSIIP